MSGKGRPNAKGMYYQPQEIRAVEGVVRTNGRANGWRHDVFVGTADALVAAGLATSGMFPGQPGMSVARTSFRPTGVEKHDGYWFATPGFLVITRKPDGYNFRIERVVSVDEQRRRDDARKRAAQALVAKRQGALLAALERKALIEERQRYVDADALAHRRFGVLEGHSHLRLVWSRPQ